VAIIIRRRVGELPPRRHIVTIFAVAIGSYLCLFLPTALAFWQIHLIARAGPKDDPVLDSDSAILSRYNNWQCVPRNINKDELEDLRSVLVRYTNNKVEIEQRTYGQLSENAKSAYSCKDKTNIVVTGIPSIFDVYLINNTIDDARKFESGHHLLRYSRFSAIWVPQSWWPVVAVGIGALTVILSYPFYVWRRIFSYG
jgi:hypothetical protein